MDPSLVQRDPRKLVYACLGVGTTQRVAQATEEIRNSHCYRNHTYMLDSTPRSTSQRPVFWAVLDLLLINQVDELVIPDLGNLRSAEDGQALLLELIGWVGARLIVAQGGSTPPVVLIEAPLAGDVYATPETLRASHPALAGVPDFRRQLRIWAEAGRLPSAHGDATHSARAYNTKYATWMLLARARFLAERVVSGQLRRRHVPVVYARTRNDAHAHEVKGQYPGHLCLADSETSECSARAGICTLVALVAGGYTKQVVVDERGGRACFSPDAEHFLRVVLRAWGASFTILDASDAHTARVTDSPPCTVWRIPVDTPYHADPRDISSAGGYRFGWMQ